MNFDEYQEKALSTKRYSEKFNIVYPALKLNGEAGEVAEKIGKILRDKDATFSEEDLFEIAKELGDVLWYINALANDIGFTLEEIAEINIKKLADRANRNMIGGSGDNR